MKKLSILSILVCLMFLAPLPSDAKKFTPSPPPPAPSPTPVPPPSPTPVPVTSVTLTLNKLGVEPSETTPVVVAPGDTLVITASLPEGAYINRFYWFNKGNSETAIASWSFGCYYFCYTTKTSTYVIPTTWSDGDDYYVKIYESSKDQFIKTNFTVQR
jgi:hypothetical protein